MGRPKKENRKTRHLDIRLSEEEYERLELMSKISGKTKTEIIMTGIRLSIDSKNKGDNEYGQT